MILNMRDMTCARSVSIFALLMIVAVGSFGCLNSVAMGSHIFENTDVAPEGHAILYLYRVQLKSAALVVPTLTVNGVKVIDLENDRYLRMVLTPGRYQVKTAWNWKWYFKERDSVTFHARAGKRYFVRVLPVSTDDFVLSLIPEKVALVEIAGTYGSARDGQ